MFFSALGAATSWRPGFAVFGSLLFSGALLFSSSPLSATTLATGRKQPTVSRLTLEAALFRALTDGSDVAVARQRVAIQRAAVIGSQVFPSNPILALGTGGRFAFAGGPGLDSRVGVRQKLPLFGRWGAQQRVASAGLSAFQADLWSAQSQVALRVTLAFLNILRLAGHLDVAQRRIELLTSIVDTAQRRLVAGDATSLDVSLWDAELGMAQAAQARLRAASMNARVDLALLCGLDPTSPPDADDVLDLETLTDWNLEAADRADVVAQMEKIEVAKKRIDLAKARAWPDLTVKANAGSEGLWFTTGPPGELIGGAGFKMPIPLFQRNQGGIARAKAKADWERAKLVQTKRRANAQVARAKTLVASSKTAALTLKTQVVDKQTEVLGLLTKAYNAGKLGVTDILLRQRSVLNAQSAYVDALSEVALARLQLANASGALSGRVQILVATTQEGKAQ